MYMVSLLSILPFTAPACGSAQGGGEAPEAPRVYFVRDITPENMVRLYEALERPATGKVAVKLSTGEPGGHNFLKPELIKDLVQKVGGTIVECNTAYGGGRASTENHLKAAADHGFTAIAPVDIMDAEGEVSLPVKGGRHLRENFVGSHYPAYDFTVVLSHFKGHAMGGFGGAVKNISIGIASSAGKAWIHSAGKTKNAAQMWGNLPAQDDRPGGAGQGMRRPGLRIDRPGQGAPDRTHGVAPRHPHAGTRRSDRAGLAAIRTRGTGIGWSTAYWGAPD